MAGLARTHVLCEQPLSILLPSAMAFSLLVPTDFFQPADRALAYADTLAAAIGAQLVLLHVRRDSLLDPERLTGRAVVQDPETTPLALASLARSLSVPVIAEVGHGRVAAAVVEALGRHQPALAVLGHRNTDDMADELVSTVPLDILRTTPQPMLVVPVRTTAAVVPRRLLLAVDEEHFSLGEHMGLVHHLLAALGAHLTLLHVAAHQSTVADRAALEAVERTGLSLDLPPITFQHLQHASPAEGILQVAANGQFDMVVLIARPRSFLGDLFQVSVTARVMLHSPVPVLVLPAA
jgi:nucleotide-binding universal stress UspA family protein